MTIATDRATRAEIAEVIADCRARAKRYSIHDARRVALDDECDLLVDDWIAAES